MVLFTFIYLNRIWSQSWACVLEKYRIPKSKIIFVWLNMHVISFKYEIINMRLILNVNTFSSFSHSSSTLNQTKNAALKKKKRKNWCVFPNVSRTKSILQWWSTRETKNKNTKNINGKVGIKYWTNRCDIIKSPSHIEHRGGDVERKMWIQSKWVVRDLTSREKIKKKWTERKIHQSRVNQNRKHALHFRKNFRYENREIIHYVIGASDNMLNGCRATLFGVKRTLVIFFKHFLEWHIRIRSKPHYWQLNNNNNFSILTYSFRAHGMLSLWMHLINR